MATVAGAKARRLSQGPLALTLAGAGIAGVALRVWVYRGDLGIPNSDEGVVGLMARHLVYDGQFPVFFWGQAYGGPQEAILAVPGVLLFGGSWLALRLVPLALFVATLWLVWRVGLRILGEPRASLAAALYWVWPPFVFYVITHEMGFYGTDVFYCALLLLLALRVVEKPDNRLSAGLFGLVAGLAFWQTSQIVPIIVAVAIWAVWRSPRCLRVAWVAVLAAVLGALPWIVWNATHSWASFDLPSGASSTYTHRLRVFFSPVLPMMLGIRTPVSQQPLLLPSAAVNLVYLVLLGLFLWGAWHTRRRPVSLLYVAAAVYPFVYGLAAQTFDSSDPRYLVVMTPVLVLLVAQVLTSWWRGALAIAVACVISVLTIHRMEPLPTKALASGSLPTAPRDLSPLVSTLDRLHLDRVYAPYLLAYVLAFHTQERIIGVEAKFDRVRFQGARAILPDHPSTRHPSWLREVAAAPRHGIVIFRVDEPSTPIVPVLLRHGWHRVPVGPFVVFAPPG